MNSMSASGEEEEEEEEEEEIDSSEEVQKRGDKVSQRDMGGGKFVHVRVCVKENRNVSEKVRAFMSACVICA